MNAEEYCASNMANDGTCDYNAVQAAIAKDLGLYKNNQKIDILCHMLRVGFNLEDTYKAGFDATDCDSASNEVSPSEACNDVSDVFDGGACASASSLESGSSKDNASTTIAVVVSIVVILLIVLTVVVLRMTRNDAFTEIERRAIATPQSTPQAFSNAAYQPYARSPESHNVNDAEC